MTQSAFSLSYGDNGIGWLKIDVANDKMNTLQAAFADQVSAVFIELSTHTDLKIGRASCRERVCLYV